MPATVPAPTTSRVRIGSLRDSIGIDWRESDRLIDTVSFFDGICAVAPTLFEVCDPDLDKTAADGSGVKTQPVFGFYESGTCTTGSDPDTIGRLLESVGRVGDNRLSFNVERGLWDGRDDANPAVDTYFLASAGADDINSGVATGVVPALSDLVAALDTALGGERGIIHVPHFALPFIQFYGQAEREGNVLRLQNTDHLIVAGTGYTGSDPDGNVTAGEPWFYATGPVGVAVSPAGNLQDIDWATNTLRIRSENSAAAYFSSCAHIGVPVCLPDPGPECGGSA